MTNNSRVSDIIIHPSESQDNKDKATKEFAQFYRAPGGEDFNLLLKQAHRRRVWLYVTTILVFLLGVALVGSYIFNGQGVSKFGEEAVQANLVVPTQAPSGQLVEYQLNYKNDQALGLKDVDITLRYPTGFVFHGSEPKSANEQGTRFTLTKVDKHASGVIVIQGQIMGEVGEKKDLNAYITFQPENLSARFSRTVTATTEIIASVVNLDISGPAQQPIDQPLTIKVNYKNSSIVKVSNLALRFTSPAGFTLQLPQLEAVVNSNNIWRLADLNPKSEGKLELVGNFSETVQIVPQEFKIAVGLVTSGGSDFVVQEEKSISVSLVRSHLTLQLTANEVSLKSSADLGQEMAYDISFVNEGETDFSNIVLKANLIGLGFDWSTFKDDSLGSVDANSGTITWSKSSVPLLEKLAPGNRGTIHSKVRLLPNLPVDLKNKPQLLARVEASFDENTTSGLHRTVSQSNEVVTKINTNLSLFAEGRYFTDELVKLGSGPLPPKVGQTTTYVIFWRLSNTLNEVDNIEVTTVLPEGVNWTGQSTVTAGQRLTYNPNTREVRWELNRLLPNIGLTTIKPEASFEVAVTPQENDADKILVLTKVATITGHDVFSEADLVATAKILTTELDDDLAAQGKGIVVR